MTTLVTGATGFIGAHFAGLLTARGESVRVLARNPSRLPPSLAGKVEVAAGDVASGAGLDEAVRGASRIIHLAGTTHAPRPSEYMGVNAGGTARLLHAVLRAGGNVDRFLLVSSQAAAGPARSPEPVREEDEPAPCTPYGRSKLAAERLVLREAGRVPITIVRPPVVYGPGDKATLGLFRIAKLGILPVSHPGDRWYSVINVIDLVRGIDLASRSAKAESGVYFLANRNASTWNDMMAGICASIGVKSAWKLNLSQSTLRIAALAGDAAQGILGLNIGINSTRLGEFLPPRWTCSAEKALRDFGFANEIPLVRGLGEAAKWYAREGWL